MRGSGRRPGEAPGPTSTSVTPPAATATTSARRRPPTEGHVAEAEALDQRGARRGDVAHGDDDVVDPGGDRVERRRRLAGGRRLVGRGIGSAAGHLDAVRLGEQHAEQLLGEVWVDAGLDGPLAAGGEHVADPRRLDDRRVVCAP